MQQAIRAEIPRDVWMLAGCICVYLVISILLLEVFPPPLPDEMLFTSPAYSLIRDGALGTPAVAGMERHAFWMPPLYFISLAPAFKIFGTGLATARVFSLFWGCVVLVLTYLLAKQMRLPPVLVTVCLFLLTVDPVFLKMSKIARPESLTLALVLGSLAFHMAWIQEGKRWNGAAIVLAALSVLSHPFGLVAPIGLILHRLAIRRGKKLSFWEILAPAVALVVFCLIFFIYAYQDGREFQLQLTGQIGRKLGRGVLIATANWLRTYTTLPAMLALTLCALYLTLSRGLSERLRSPTGAAHIFAVLSLLVVIPNFELFYSLYYLPLILLSGAGALAAASGGKNWEASTVLKAVVLAALVNAALYDAYFAYLYRFRLRTLTSTAQLANQIEDAIPDRASVLLLGVPNLFWQLERQRNDITLYFPWSLDLRSEDLLARRVQILIVARAFSASYDEYIGKEVEYWSAIFQRRGRRLKLLREVGQDLPYAYRAVVYAIW
jgi:4-amino-4-deoxy-L-arabinose transferase-like glycosyltransferase